jgi:hypothetical protein
MSNEQRAKKRNGDECGIRAMIVAGLRQKKEVTENLVECEGHERIAQGDGAVAVAAGCNDDVLPSAEGVGHRRCHRWNRERQLLQFLTCRGVKDTQPGIFRSGCDNEARTGDNRAAKVSDSRLLAGDHCSKRLLPHLGQRIEIDG